MSASKRLILIDDELLAAAQAASGASTIRETVDRALRGVVAAEAAELERRLAVLESADLADRGEAWRD